MSISPSITRDQSEIERRHKQGNKLAMQRKAIQLLTLMRELKVITERRGTVKFSFVDHTVTRVFHEEEDMGIGELEELLKQDRKESGL